jgi:polyisoprenoid-binding protein YceI
MTTSTLTSPYTYSIDPAHSSARFWVRHMMIAKVHGEFSAISGTVVGNLQDPQHAKVHIEIDAQSINTGNEQRDAHLRSADFFNADTHPKTVFDSKQITRSGDHFDVVGDLTINGITREVVLKTEVTEEAKSPFGNGFKVGVSATGQINREDFGIVWNQTLETGGVLVGKEIYLTIDVELDRE